MSSPDDLNKFIATPFYASDDFWPFIEGSGSSSRLNIEDNNTGLSPFLFDEQEKFPLAHGKTGNSILQSSHNHLQDNISHVPTEATCPIVQENSCHHPAKKDNNEINSCLLVLNEQENSALIEPGTLLASGVNYQCNKDNYLSKFLEAFDHNTIRPIDEDHQGEKVNQESTSGGFDSSTLLFPDEQETSRRLLIADGNETSGRGEGGNRIRGKNPRSSWKKREHNVKEKERRMKLNESFLALEKLLPNSQKSKKRSSIPVMIDRAVKYIPELQKEVDKLNQKKNELVSSSTESSRRNLTVNTQSETMPEAPTISVNEVVKGEVIIKTVCTVKDQDTVFSHLLQNVEAEGMCTISGSTLQVSKEWVCYHLHVQMPSSSFAVDDDYVAVLTEKVTSWFH